MASLEYSQFPEWQHADRPRKGRDTLIIALFATVIGITAGASTMAFFMGQNISATSSAQTSSLKFGQPKERQPTLGTPNSETTQDQSPAFDKAVSESDSQSKPSADGQPLSTAQPSTNPSSASTPNDATSEATIRAEAEKPATDAAVAYCMQRYRSYDPASRTFLGNDGRRHPCPREAN